MNEAKAKPSTNEGWSVHVYDKNRHLRFTLEPLHLWIFGWGIGVGILSAVIWSVLSGSSDRFLERTQHSINPPPIPETHSEKGSHPNPDNSFPLGID